MNQNPDNEGLLQKYTSTAQMASKNLDKEFKEFWTNPGAKIMMAEKESTEDNKSENKDDEEWSLFLNKNKAIFKKLDL